MFFERVKNGRRSSLTFHIIFFFLGVEGESDDESQKEHNAKLGAKTIKSIKIRLDNKLKKQSKTAKFSSQTKNEMNGKRNENLQNEQMSQMSNRDEKNVNFEKGYEDDEIISPAADDEEKGSADEGSTYTAYVSL